MSEAAENEDSVEDDPDSPPDNEATQNFPSMKPLVEDNAKYHDNQIILANANGKENASPIDLTESREATSKKEDESLSADPPDNEATQHFPLAKPLKIGEIYNYGEDDEAYEAETQIDDDENDVCQAETQTLSFLTVDSLAKPPTPKRQEVCMKQSLMHRRFQRKWEKIMSLPLLMPIQRTIKASCLKIQRHR